MAKSKQADVDEMLEQSVSKMGKGVLGMFRSPVKIVVFIAIILVCRYVTAHRVAIGDAYSFPPESLFAVWLIPLFALLGFASSAPQSWDEKFEQIAFKNRNGSYPKLISKKKSKGQKGNMYELVFNSPGIPIENWKSSIASLQSTFGGNIIDIKKYKGSTQKVQVLLMDEGVTIPESLEWDDKLIREKDFELIAGEGLVEDAVFNLNKYPHGLIAGMTGSGKSVTLRCLLWQCVKKGAKLYIVDFKGGVEFKNWENLKLAEVVTEEESASKVFNHLQEEMKQRLQLFSQENVKNIAEYNKKHPEAPLCRIILGCDEVAEMLDVEGLPKEEKKEKEALSQVMASLARLSRAAGIHMLLGMQRPDAKVLKGQIKNNTPIRISGMFPDVVASEIVIGGPQAAFLDNIPGRMLYNLGAKTHEFQAYYFDDDKWLKSGNYQIGTMLNNSPLGTSSTPIGDNEFKEFEIPQQEMAEWDWADMNAGDQNA